MPANNRSNKTASISIAIVFSALLLAVVAIFSGHNASAAPNGSAEVPMPVATQPTALPTRTVPPAGTATNTPVGFNPTATGTPRPGAPTATNTRGVPRPDPTALPTLCILRFSDVSQNDWFYPYVAALYCHGAISGYSDGTFRPYNNTTRGQLSKIIVLANAWPINTTGGPHFTDVPSTNPFYPYIETAYAHNAISGYSDGTFRWGNNITRGQLSKIVVLARGWSINTAGGPHFSDVLVGSPFYTYVETGYNKGVVSGYTDGSFRPGSDATRAQLSKIVQTSLLVP